MPSVVAWFSPDDTLLLEQTTIIRIVGYDLWMVNLAIQGPAGTERVTIKACGEWTKIAGILHVKYLGIFENKNCKPTLRAGIEFRDPHVVDIRKHSFAGVPIFEPSRMGHYPR